MICFILILLIAVQRHESDFIFLTACLILWPDILNAIGMFQVLVLILSSGTELLNNVSNSSVNFAEHHLFVFIHTNIGVVVNAFNAHAKLAVTKMMGNSYRNKLFQPRVFERYSTVYNYVVTILSTK